MPDSQTLRLSNFVILALENNGIVTCRTCNSGMFVLHAKFPISTATKHEAILAMKP